MWVIQRFTWWADTRKWVRKWVNSLDSSNEAPAPWAMWFHQHASAPWQRGEDEHFSHVPAGAGLELERNLICWHIWMGSWSADSGKFHWEFYFIFFSREGCLWLMSADVNLWEKRKSGGNPSKTGETAEELYIWIMPCLAVSPINAIALAQRPG